MKEIFAEIMNKPQGPSMTDIERLLASIGAPGDKREEKRKVVQDLVDNLGLGTNPQGISLVESLSSYGEF